MSGELQTSIRKVACCVLRVASSCRTSATRNTQHATPVLRSAFRSPQSIRAFTLIEIMIVVAIMGIVMTMSVPIVYKVWRKAPMRQAVSETVEVFSNARARAIMQGTVMEVVLRPKENVIAISGAAAPAHPPGEGGASKGAGSGLSAQLPSDIIIETLDINMSGIEYNDAEVATVRFYPNGISDELRMILFDGRDRMGIELETTTGLANVVPDPLREWTRR